MLRGLNSLFPINSLREKFSIRFVLKLKNEFFCDIRKILRKIKIELKFALLLYYDVTD